MMKDFELFELLLSLFFFARSCNWGLERGEIRDKPFFRNNQIMTF